MENITTQQAGVRRPDIVVRKHGPITDDQAGQARERLARVLARIGEPILKTELTLTVLREPAPPKPAFAQVAVELKGRTIRARAAEATPGRAVALMCDRLSIRLGHVAHH